MRSNFNGFGASGGLEKSSGWLGAAAVLHELVWLHSLDVIRGADGIDGSVKLYGVDELDCLGWLDGPGGADSSGYPGGLDS